MTAAILLACTLAFSLEIVVMVQGGDAALEAFVNRFGLVPADLVAALKTGAVLSLPTLTLFTHMFLHGSWLHLFGNALFLWIFGPRVEDRMGRPLFLVFFLAGGVAAAVCQVLADPTSDMAMIGASGAISAVLGGYLVLYPRAKVQSLVFLVFYYDLIAVPALAVLGFWFGLQLIDAFASLGLTAQVGGGVAFWAHVGGFLAGVLMALPLRALRREPDPLAIGPGVSADGMAPANAALTPATAGLEPPIAGVVIAGVVIAGVVTPAGGPALPPAPPATFPGPPPPPGRLRP